jgi:hypothetical protein
MDFYSTHVFGVKKEDYAVHFASAGIIIAKHIISHFVKTRTNTR